MVTPERIGETLARRMHRRKLLNKAAAAMFGGVAAWSVSGLWPDRALAAACTEFSNVCTCNPPVTDDRHYCTDFDVSFCSGSSCAGGCTPAYDTDITNGWSLNSGGCWCTLDCCNTGSLGNKGHYKCCDCKCKVGGINQYCGCRSFQITQVGGCPSVPPP